MNILNNYTFSQRMKKYINTGASVHGILIEWKKARNAQNSLLVYRKKTIKEMDSTAVKREQTKD